MRRSAAVEDKLNKLAKMKAFFKRHTNTANIIRPNLQVWRNDWLI